MKNKLLTEINNMRRIMGLELLMEGPKDDLYQLMKKFSAKETSEIEKNEIEALLKKAGVNDNELKLLKQGQAAIINSLSGRLVNKLTGELGQQFEKAFLERGIPIKALSNLPGGPRLVTTIEDIHTKYMKGEITLETYKKAIQTIKDKLSTTLNREELERAIKSIEANNEYRAKNPTVADDISRQSVMPDITPGEVLPDRPLDTPSPTPAEDFIKLYGEKELERAKRWFKGYTEEGIDKLFKDVQDKYAKENLLDSQKKQIEDFVKTLGKNRVGEFWALQSNWAKGIIIAAILEGPNMVYFLIKMGLPKELIGLIPVVGPYFLPSDEEKEKEKTEEKIKSNVTKPRNYGVYVGDKFYTQLSTFIKMSGTSSNQLENKVNKALEERWSQDGSGTTEQYQVAFMEKCAKEKLQPIFDNIPEFKSFTVKALPEQDWQKSATEKIEDLILKAGQTWEEIKNSAQKVNTGGSGGTGSGGTGSGGTGSGGTGSKSSGGGVPPWKK